MIYKLLYSAEEFTKTRFLFKYFVHQYYCGVAATVQSCSIISQLMSSQIRPFSQIVLSTNTRNSIYAGNVNVFHSICPLMFQHSSADKDISLLGYSCMTTHWMDRHWVVSQCLYQTQPIVRLLEAVACRVYASILTTTPNIHLHQATGFT